MRQAVTRAVRNKSAKSAVRTYVKKATTAVAGSVQDAAEVVREAVRALDKAAQKGIVHPNAAARRKSRLMGRLHQLSIVPREAPQAAPAKPAPKAAKGAAKAPARRTASAPKSTAAAKKPATAAAKKPAARKPAAKATE
jgi:small subunit ribosomal protein S20